MRLAAGRTARNNGWTLAYEQLIKQSYLLLSTHPPCERATGRARAPGHGVS